MIVLLFANSIFEMIGLAAFLPLFSVILQPGIIQSNAILSRIYHAVGFSSERSFTLVLVTMLVLIIIIKNIASLFIVRSQAKFSLSLYQSFAERLHQLYYSKGFPFFKKTNSNIILRNIHVVPSHFANNIVLSIFNLLNEFVVLSLIVLGLMLYDIKAILLLTIVILPVFLLFYNWVKNRALKIEKEMNAITPQLTQSIFQSVHGFADVEITNTQHRFRKRITDLIGQTVLLNIKRTVYGAAPTKVIESGIARALYSGADVLFFDEATSVLDSKTEDEITESIRNLADGKLTLVIIAHRETTLRYCSRIIKL
jgi:ABC-type multidrug transport system fused ATPase/permease subunit